MPCDPPPLHRADVRGTDSNSLLRLYDQAKQALKASATQREREAAESALGMIAKELRKRRVSV